MRVPDVVYLSDKEEVAFLEYMKRDPGVVVDTIPEEYDRMLSDVQVIRFQKRYSEGYSRGLYRGTNYLYILEVLNEY